MISPKRFLASQETLQTSLSILNVVQTLDMIIFFMFRWEMQTSFRLAAKALCYNDSTGFHADLQCLKSANTASSNLLSLESLFQLNLPTYIAWVAERSESNIEHFVGLVHLISQLLFRQISGLTSTKVHFFCNQKQRREKTAKVFSSDSISSNGTRPKFLFASLQFHHHIY